MSSDLIIKYCCKNLLNICLVSTVFNKLVLEKKDLLIRKKLQKLFSTDIMSYFSMTTNIDNELKINYSILELNKYSSYNIFINELHASLIKSCLTSKRLESPIRNYIYSLKTRFSLSIL